MSVLSRLTPLAAVAITVVLGGCSSPQPAPVATTAAPAPGTTDATTSLTATPTPTVTTESPSPTPTPASASASPTAAQETPAAGLARLAGDAPRTVSATYALESTESGAAEVRIDLLPAGYRVSVTRKGATAMLIVRRGGDSISCSRGKCFVVAKEGRGVPSAFDPQVQHTMTDYLTFFAAAPDELRVADSEVKAPGTCFDVQPSGTGPTEIVAGTYCLDGDGVTAIDFAKGSMRRLSVNPAPTAEILKPPFTPTPVPSATTPQEPTD
ncbi:MAG: hypothetical protein JWM93_3797 [Frankiales bacterium]|nr:hypothetical protein [Frankiales bacterium]